MKENTFEDFIKMEGDIIVNMLQKYNNQIIATGGSVIYSEQFRNNLSNNLVIYLQVSENCLHDRLGNFVSRGVLSKTRIDTIEGLMNERIPLYENVADVIVNTEKWSAVRVATFIKYLL